MDAKVLPLAVTMMAGPQIISSIIFVTKDRAAVRTSLAYIGAIALACCAGIGLATLLANLLDGSIDLGDDTGLSSAAKAIELVLVGVLVLRALSIYRRRATSEPPKWLGTLQTASPRRAFELGLALILLMPGDLIVMATAGIHLVGEGHSFADALPLIGFTALIAALPLLFYLLFGQRAERVMPITRDWMNSHSWVINIAVYVVFIVLIFP
jgi:Sap, sulfolipid-1-addressing protein